MVDGMENLGIFVPLFFSPSVSIMALTCSFSFLADDHKKRSRETDLVDVAKEDDK